MPRIRNWIGANRADDAWARINDKPTSIVISRKTGDLAEQTVRLEYDNTAAEVTGQGNTITSVQRARVFGIRGHSTIADTDIKKGDKFAAHGVIFRVLSVIPQTGEIQALCEVAS